MKQDFFLQMIMALRSSEEIILYNNILKISEEEEELVGEFLRREYLDECNSLPFEAPIYDEVSALWAAKLVYIAAQLILFRKQKADEIGVLFNTKPAPTINPSSILSTDLTLRFIPQMIFHLKAIDPADELIEILESILQTWHFSGINYQNLKVENLNFDLFLSNAFVRQQYIDRVILSKNEVLGSTKPLQQLISQQLGMFADTFWPKFEINK